MHWGGLSLSAQVTLLQRDDPFFHVLFLTHGLRAQTQRCQVSSAQLQRQGGTTALTGFSKKRKNQRNCAISAFVVKNKSQTRSNIGGRRFSNFFFFFFNWNLLQTNMHFTYRISLVSQLAFSYLMLINKINKLFIVVFLVRLYMFCIIVTNFSVITFLCDQKFKAYLCYHLVQSFIIFVYFC